MSGCTGFEPACGTRPLLPITQTQRPVEIGAPGGHRTHISRTESGRSIAVELRDCPRGRANFERRSRMRFCCRFRQSQMGKWRDRTEALRAGNRTRTAQVFTQDGTPSFVLVEDNRSTSAHRNWGGQTDSHRHQRLHRALCCYYTMTTMKWSPWSDSHRRIRVYETRPVAAEAQRQNGVHGRSCTCDLHLRRVAL